MNHIWLDIQNQIPVFLILEEKDCRFEMHVFAKNAFCNHTVYPRAKNMNLKSMI